MAGLLAEDQGHLVGGERGWRVAERGWEWRGGGGGGGEGVGWVGLQGLPTALGQDPIPRLIVVCSAVKI